MPSVLNDWVLKLTYMQQSVLLCALRNHDGFNKHNPAKEITRYLRRAILKSAFDGRMLYDPFEPGGGNFTGPLRTKTVHDAVTAFLDGRDEMSLHYFMHAVHAFQIIGYKCPYPILQLDFMSAYQRAVSCLHLMPESEYDMDRRLSDNEEKWAARSDAYERAAYQKEKTEAAVEKIETHLHNERLTAVDAINRAVDRDRPDGVQLIDGSYERADGAISWPLPAPESASPTYASDSPGTDSSTGGGE